MSRRTFAGAKLTEDAARLLAEDKVSPPDAKPSLMDAVRALSPYIEARAKVGWTDPMIAALLTEMGYPIEGGTLRSYRTRLRKERAEGVATKGEPAPDALPTSASVESSRAPVPSASGRVGEAGPASSSNVSPELLRTTPPRAAPSPPASPSPRTLAVRGNLPPERA